MKNYVSLIIKGRVIDIHPFTREVPSSFRSWSQESWDPLLLHVSKVVIKEK